MARVREQLVVGGKSQTPQGTAEMPENFAQPYVRLYYECTEKKM